ncbi:MAG TPA: EI24 domain-containing protein [Burkholderiaceae bacterium]|jgi:hypothetical protein
MKALLFSFGRAVASQMHPRMLLLTLLPFGCATLLWGFLLWLGLQPLIDIIGRYFAQHDTFAVSGKWLAFMGLAALKTLIVPLIAMWLLLPLMLVTALIFVGLMAMPAIVRHVGRHYHPALERRHGGNLLTLLWVTVSSLSIFVILWIVTLPLCALPVVGFAIQPLLWGWLTCRLIASEVLAVYADKAECVELMRKHRWHLLAIGTLCGAMGVAPSLLWMGGVAAVVLFPFFAALSIWLYVLVFTFSGLWFAHYGLTAITAYRVGRSLDAEIVVEEMVTPRD